MTRTDQRPDLTKDAVLAPCPFCGATPICPADAGDDDFVVVCTACGAASKYSDDRAEVIAAWNRRTSPKGEPFIGTCMKCDALVVYGEKDRSDD